MFLDEIGDGNRRDTGQVYSQRGHCFLITLQLCLIRMQSCSQQVAITFAEDIAL